METRCSPKSHHAELARVNAALHRHQPDPLGDGGAHDLEHAKRGVRVGEVERRTDMFRESLGGGCGVQAGSTPEEVAGIQVAQRQTRIGYSGVGAALAIARRAGIRAGAVRADVEDATFIHSGDAAAAGAQGVDIDHRSGNLPTGLELLVGDVRDTVFDQRNIRAGPTHVEGDDLWFRQQLSQVRSGADASGRAGQNGAHRHPAGIVDWRNPAVGLHDQHVLQLRVRFEALTQVGQIAAEHRTNVGVDHCRAQSVEFLDLRDHLVGEGGVHIRESALYDFSRLSLVGGIEVREQETNRQRFGSLLNQVFQLLFQRCGVQRAVNDAVRPDPFRYVRPEVAGGQRFHGRHPQVVPVFFQPLAHLQQIAETVGGDQSNLGAFPLHQRVGGDRRAVDHQVGVSQHLLQRQAVRGGSFPQADHDALRRVVGSGRRFEKARPPGFADHHEVCERASDVYPDFVHLGPPRFAGGSRA